MTWPTSLPGSAGLSKRARRAIETGEIEITEWTTLPWPASTKRRLWAYLHSGPKHASTDTVKHSAAVEMECPLPEKYLALPALYPDVAIIHAPR